MKDRIKKVIKRISILAGNCEHCNGTGWIGGQIVCPACGGTDNR